MSDTITLTTMSTARTIVRNTNPFAPIAKLHNQNMQPANPYESLSNRASSILNNVEVKDAIKNLKNRLKGQVYSQKDFGYLMEIDESLIDVNTDIQRSLDPLHCAKNIIELFDPRIMQPLNVIYIKETGRYSDWDGLQSGSSFWILKAAGLIAPGTKIQCKVVDNDLMIPGSFEKGEATGNRGFRILGGRGRKGIEPFYLHRSRVNGVRLYDSTLDEDLRSCKIQEVFEANNMFPAPADDTKHNKLKPGMVTHLSAVNKIANLNADSELSFNAGIKDLEWALNWHDTYFNGEDGVDGGFILAFGRLHAEATQQKVELTEQFGEEMYKNILNFGGSPSGFHKDCKTKLKAFQVKNHLKESWTDACLTPLLVMSYIKNGGTCPVPNVLNMVAFAGIV